MRNAMSSDGFDEFLAGIYENLRRCENPLFEFSASATG